MPGSEQQPAYIPCTLSAPPPSPLPPPPSLSATSPWPARGRCLMSGGHGCVPLTWRWWRASVCVQSFSPTSSLQSCTLTASSEPRPLIEQCTIVYVCDICIAPGCGLMSFSSSGWECMDPLWSMRCVCVCVCVCVCCHCVLLFAAVFPQALCACG